MFLYLQNSYNLVQRWKLFYWRWNARVHALPPLFGPQIHVEMQRQIIERLGTVQR